MNLQDILKRLNEQTIMLSEVSSELQKISEKLIKEYADEELKSTYYNDGRN